MLLLLLRLEHGRLALRRAALGVLARHRESYFGLALVVLVVGVLPPLGLVPLAALVSTFAALVLVLAGFAFLVTLVLAPASLLFF